MQECRYRWMDGLINESKGKEKNFKKLTNVQAIEQNMNSSDIVHDA